MDNEEGTTEDPLDAAPQPHPPMRWSVIIGPRDGRVRGLEATCFVCRVTGDWAKHHSDEGRPFDIKVAEG